jgi:EAL domain-containing protein (putative c-di-GMP-specific phosphodiesterase class I)
MDKARPDGDWSQIERLLTRLRTHLGMEVAWLSVFRNGEQVIVAASGDTAAMNVRVGEGTELGESYCTRVNAGNVPAVIPDARRHLVTRELPITRALNIGSYAGSPWRIPGTEVTGMLCCVSRLPQPELDETVPQVLRFVAAAVGDHLTRSRNAVADITDREQAIRTVLDRGVIPMAFQPALRLSDSAVSGVEALARFDHPAFPTPDRAFAAAAQFGLGVELELLAIRCALAELPRIPADVLLCVNLSADALLDSRVQETVLAVADRRVGVEITEHVQVSDYLELVSATERLRAAGVRIVVDDAGAGYASLSHILQLRPSVIKLDIGLVRGVADDPVRRALARSLVGFAAEIGAALVAEGIETPEEYATLTELGVGYGQGYLLGRPAPLASLSGLRTPLPQDH